MGPWVRCAGRMTYGPMDLWTYGLAFVSGYVRNGPRCRDFPREDVRPREAIHVATAGKAEERQDRRRDVDDRPPRQSSRLHGRPVCEQEAVGGALVAAAPWRVADRMLEQPPGRGEVL